VSVVLDRIFLPLQLIHGHIAVIDDTFPSRLAGWRNNTLVLPADGTHFGYVHQDSATLETRAGTFELRKGMYFVAPHECRIDGPGEGIVITSLGYYGMFSLGGPIEPAGRLRYIDGCTDSLLIPPPTLGDPCLNALYFPRSILQTDHTHPSIRIGLVAHGKGQCRTSEATYTLSAGLAFVIRADGLHSFSTTNDEMIIIAYHPDSDFGPTDNAHPMVNRTIVRGVPASELENIRTGRPKDT
jgi:hypothetical protein